ncbi:MAG: rhaB [Frankiales bacterium]|jgi:rhamnulokinase|nr:rhaB [Frankiales bacterium]
MSASHRCVAVDLGAESGRVVVGSFDGVRLHTEVVHRFANVPRQRDGHLRWDMQRLWDDVRTGLRSAGEQGVVDSVGVDTWGIDFGFLDGQGRLLADPVSHRDGRTRHLVELADKLVGHRLYHDTGTQIMHINSVFQLMAETRNEGLPGEARTLLMVPDIFHHLLSGSRVAEYTAVSTTGAYDMATRTWAVDLLEDLGVRTDLLPEVVDAGTDLGSLQPELADAPGLAATRVITPGSHDTASAVAAVPFLDPHAGYISSGTWSLVGVERERPVINAAAETANLTNEGGVAGTVRLLRNVMGLWILQECRRQWEREGMTLSYPDLVQLAQDAPAHHAVVDVDHPAFVEPGDMPERIREFCRRSGQPVPSSVGEISRCVLEGLTLRYRYAFDQIAKVTGTPVTAVHVVGGGSRNDVLNRATAAATQLPVIAGPVEATAMGNLLVQLCSLGELGGLDDIRDVVRATEPTRDIDPDPSAAARWDDAYARLHELIAVAPADLA